MFLLVLGAVRARTAQVLTILVLAALAAAVAVAGPWFAFAAAEDAATADIEKAQAFQRMVSVRSGIDTLGRPQEAIERFTRDVRAGLPPEFGDPVVGMSAGLNAREGSETPGMAVAYRDEFCANVRLEGTCPGRRGEVAISQDAARRLGLAIGDPLDLTSTTTNRAIDLRVVGVYTLVGVAEPYWAGEMFRTSPPRLDPAFTVVDTFAAQPLWNCTMVYDIELPAALIRGDGGYDLAPVVAAADTRLTASRLRVQTGVGPLLEQVARDRATILSGVRTASLQLLVLTLFAVGLAGWYTLRDRRPDTALLKLRGVTRSRMLRLAWGQHLVALSLGVLAGVPIGYLLARLLAGPVTVAPDRAAAFDQSVTAVAAVLFGSLAVLAVVEAAMLGRPVATLLQSATPGRGDWRSALADLILLAIAGAAIYQARSSGPGDGLGVLAPALVALALGLLVARLLRRLAGRAGGAALRAGRFRTGLAALQFSRSAGADRVFALVVVAVALFVTAAGGWQADRVARETRSIAELGADRVLTVDAPNRTALLHAVRSADPGGREAMAAVRSRNDDNLEILEVDSARLATVALWRPDYGPVTTLPAAMTAAAPPESPMVTADRVTAVLRRDGPVPLQLTLQLQNEATGLPATAVFGPLPAGEQTVSAPVAGCTEAPGCRIVRWELTAVPNRNGRVRPAAGSGMVTIRSLTQPGADATVLDATVLGDVKRWRTGNDGAGVNVATTGGALRLSGDENTAEVRMIGTAVWAADSPVPMPLVVVGPEPDDWRFDEPGLASYGEPIGVRVAGTASHLPSAGRAGLLIDLDAARRLAAEDDPGGVLQVWLAAGARPGIVADLTAAGLTVVTDETVAGRTAWLGAQGPAAVTRFALLAGIAALLLAAATVAVAVSVDNRSLSAQLRALRVQGLPRRAAVAAGYTGIIVLLLTALAGGVLAAVLARSLIEAGAPGFADGWQVLPPPPQLTGSVVALSAAGVLVLLGVTAALALLPMIRDVRRSGR